MRYTLPQISEDRHSLNTTKYIWIMYDYRIKVLRCSFPLFSHFVPFFFFVLFILNVITHFSSARSLIGRFKKKVFPLPAYCHYRRVFERANHTLGIHVCLGTSPPGRQGPLLASKSSPRSQIYSVKTIYFERKMREIIIW